MCDCATRQMPDIYEAFKDTVEKHGLAEATRQLEEMNDRLAAERIYAHKLLIKFAAMIAIVSFFFWIIS